MIKQRVTGLLLSILELKNLLRMRSEMPSKTKTKSPVSFYSSYRDLVDSDYIDTCTLTHLD